MKLMKQFVSAALTLCLTLGALAVPAAAAGTFADVTDTDTAQAVESLRLLGVLDGYADGSFRPAGSLTRAQFCKMAVYATCGGNEVGLYSAVTVFPDVKPSHWAAPYINMAAKGKSIIAGYADGKFRPESTVTVAHAATILLRLLGYQDADVGGTWPDGYLATGRRIGLLDGITGGASTPLTRAQAARIFANLLRCQTKDGADYLSVLAGAVKGSVVSDVLLVSSNAIGADGRSTAMKTADGRVYSVSGGKSSSGLLNGQRGDLLLDQSGKVLTFVPDGTGSARQVTIASRSAGRISGTDGAVYTLSASTAAYYEGRETTWGDVYSWLRPGAAVTLYLDATGSVVYVMAGGSQSDEAVVVASNGSDAGLQELTGNASNVKIVKNGQSATLADLRAWDVVTYAPEDNTLRVCDTRVTVYYETCYPNAKEPETIRVLGQELTVLPMARESLSAFKPGSRMTLLLTDGGQVAGAVAVGSGVKSNAVGIARGDGTLQLLCGSAQIAVGGSEAANFAGEAAEIYADQDGIHVSPLTNRYGALDVTKSTLGGKKVSAQAAVYQNGSCLSLADLKKARYTENEISYARTNWAGEVDLIVLKGAAGGLNVYGYAVVTPATDSDDDQRLAVCTPDGTVGPFVCNLAAENGAWVKGTLRADRTSFRLMETMTRFANVRNSAWNGRYSVVLSGQTYAVAEDVICYNRDAGTWMTLDQARAYSDTATLYLADGVVRVVEVCS